MKFKDLYGEMDIPMELTQQQHNVVSKTLKDLLVSLEQDIEEAEKSSQPVTLDQQAFGRVSRVDAIQQQQMQAAVVRRMKKRLSMVKGAIQRLGSDDFGICIQCEEPIAFDRLMIRPESLACISCAQQAE